jgi:predicted transporter
MPVGDKMRSRYGSIIGIVLATVLIGAGIVAADGNNRDTG